MAAVRVFASTRALYPSLRTAQRNGVVSNRLWYSSSAKSTSAKLNSRRKNVLLASGLFGATAAVTGAVVNNKESNTMNKENQESDKGIDGGLRKFSKEEVAQHRTAETGIWITYRGGVYDVTEFVNHHPGGLNKIMMAAGASIDPFWAMYAQHNTEQVRSILETYRIGDLKGWDNTAPCADPYENEPSRHPSLVVRSSKPFNAETPIDIIADNFITPNELFYVRNHLPVPVVDPMEYKLIVEGEGVKRIELSLDDLKTKFKKHTVTATIMCAGNRRDEFNKVKMVKGTTWDMSAVSNATWGGVWLRDVLTDAGLHGTQEVLHVHFEGLDKDIEKVPYGSSIPIKKAMSKYGDVMLAYEMNGVPIPPDHGYPVRAIVPGTVGARNVKWLGRIVTAREESQSHWQTKDYKGFSPNVEWDTVDFSSALAIQQLPVTSAMCAPTDGSTYDTTDDSLTVKGYAYSGGGFGIVRVDVSLDGGKNWHTADMEKPSQTRDQVWAWTPWSAEVDIPETLRGKDLEIVCKAVDSCYNVQPDSIAPIWNLRGILNNAWHRVICHPADEEDNGVER